MKYLCPIHKKEVKPSKFREGEYWHKEPEMVRACTSNEADLIQVSDTPESFKEDLGVKSNGDDTMSKADWALKDRRISRLALAKAYIGAGMDFDHAVQTNDLLKWEHWVWEGEV